MTNKEKFVKACTEAHCIIQDDSLIMKYLPSMDALSYRVLGEEVFIYLDEIDDSAFQPHEDYWGVLRFGRVCAFRFYTQLPIC